MSKSECVKKKKSECVDKIKQIHLLVTFLYLECPDAS